MSGDDPVVGILTSAGHTLAVAESLTGGCLSTRFAQRPDASQWYRGAVVAYAREVKHQVLGVRPGPVVSREAALDMARGVRQLLGSSAAMAVTGVAGPGEQDGQPPGTVWLAVDVDGTARAVCLDLGGSPEAIIEQTCDRAVALLTEQIQLVANSASRPG
jgi:nicotinamide-nucleotide amidase